MGFFDQIKDTVTKGARDLADGAKELADKNRINKDIANIENELRNHYRDIGLKFFEENSANVPDEYKELFDGIGTLKENLEAKRKELEAIEGKNACPNCGKAISKDAKFCAACGQTIPQPEAAPARAGVTCPNCGASLAEGAAFCASCGNKITPAAEAPAAPASNVCPNCGEALAADAVFCANCGTKAPGLD